MPIPSFLGSPRQFLFAAPSIVLGLWAFKMVGEVSGPAFEPIIAVCGDPAIPPDEFATRTGYHSYEPLVGLGAFKILVCLITQFLLELRETHPAGMITWCGLMLTGLPFGVLATIEAGRAGARGPVRYPVLMGLAYQLLGISVVVPLLWVPSYIYGAGDGAVSAARSYASIPISLPGLLLTAAVFTANTDGQLWTTCAGILGGPGLPLAAGLLWRLTPPLTKTKDALTKSADAAAFAYRAVAPVAFLGYACLVYVTYTEYGVDGTALWGAVWSGAGPSVAFMTIDAIVLYVAVCLYIAFRDVGGAIKAVALTPVVGPGAAIAIVMAALEEEPFALASKLD